jgi:NTP pyrophosphatase (non-canonical NTP hydrolase)
VTPRDALTFASLAATNRDRCESASGFGHPLSGWTLSDWFTAAMGELGEAANKAKKLNRVRDGIPGNTETEDELWSGLADEIADTVIYLDLLAQAAGFDLGSAVVSKFNRKSEEIGAPHRLPEVTK